MAALRTTPPKGCGLPWLGQGAELTHGASRLEEHKGSFLHRISLALKQSQFPQIFTRIQDTDSQQHYSTA